LSKIVETTSAIISRVIGEGRKALLENEAKAICIDYGIPVPRFVLAKSQIESAQLLSKLAFLLFSR